jgi:hypothetical protein
VRELTNAHLDAEVVELDTRRKGRIKLVPFNSIKLSTDRRYLVKGLIPHPGLTLIWGPLLQEDAIEQRMESSPWPY